MTSYALLKQHYKGWIEEALRNGKNVRQSKWTTSVAVGNKRFVERVKVEMGALAIGKKSTKPAMFITCGKILPPMGPILVLKTRIFDL